MIYLSDNILTRSYNSVLQNVSDKHLNGPCVHLDDNKILISTKRRYRHSTRIDDFICIKYTLTPEISFRIHTEKNLMRVTLRRKFYDEQTGKRKSSVIKTRLTQHITGNVYNLFQTLKQLGY